MEYVEEACCWALIVGDAAEVGGGNTGSRNVRLLCRRMCTHSQTHTLLLTIYLFNPSVCNKKAKGTRLTGLGRLVSQQITSPVILGENENNVAKTCALKRRNESGPQQPGDFHMTT